MQSGFDNIQFDEDLSFEERDFAQIIPAQPNEYSSLRYKINQSKSLYQTSMKKGVLFFGKSPEIKKLTQQKTKDKKVKKDPGVVVLEGWEPS